MNETAHLIKIRKMTGTRGPKRKTMEAEVGEKRSKLEEELKAKMVKVKQEQVMLDENLEGYKCPLCSVQLNCAPGDRAMKRFIDF